MYLAYAPGIETTAPEVTSDANAYCGPCRLRNDHLRGFDAKAVQLVQYIVVRGESMGYIGALFNFRDISRKVFRD